MYSHHKYTNTLNYNSIFKDKNQETVHVDKMIKPCVHLLIKHE